MVLVSTIWDNPGHRVYAGSGIVRRICGCDRAERDLARPAPDRNMAPSDHRPGEASARTAINPRGYDPPPSNALNALNPTAFAAWFNGQVSSVMSNLARINAQGVVLWDAEGLEFLQPLSYVGAPNHLSDLSPEMNTVIDAGMATIKAGGYKLGVTLRPQHLLYGTSLPGTCNNGPSTNYDDVFINLTAYTYPSSTRVYHCTATNTWTATSNNGPGFQTDFLTNSYASVLAELEAKLSAAVTRWGVSFVYIDSTVWVGGTLYQWDLWQQIRADFPNVAIFPEDNSIEYAHWAYTLPYRKAQTFGIGFETPPSVLNYYSTAASFMDLGNEVTSTNQAAIQDGIAKGDISAVGVWFTNNPEQSNLIAYQANAQLTNSAALITDTSTGIVHSYQADPGGGFAYPLVMRIYFAASSAVAGSNTYCEMKSSVSCWQSGSPTGSSSLNLSGLGWYMVSYYDFNGRPGQRWIGNPAGMKEKHMRTKLFAVLLVAFAFRADAQQTLNGGFTGLGKFDYSSPLSIVPYRAGTGSPNGRDNCVKIGEMYAQSDATAGSNSWMCTAPGTPGVWTLQGNGASGGTGNAASRLAVAFSTTPAYTCLSSSTGTTTIFAVAQLTNNITSSTSSGCTNGQKLDYVFQQGASAYTVQMPTGYDGCLVAPTANLYTTCSYVWDSTAGLAHLIGLPVTSATEFSVRLACLRGKAQPACRPREVAAIRIRPHTTVILLARRDQSMRMQGGRERLTTLPIRV